VSEEKSCQNIIIVYNNGSMDSLNSRRQRMQTEQGQSGQACATNVRVNQLCGHMESARRSGVSRSRSRQRTTLQSNEEKLSSNEGSSNNARKRSKERENPMKNDRAQSDRENMRTIGIRTLSGGSATPHKPDLPRPFNDRKGFTEHPRPIPMPPKPWMHSSARRRREKD